VQAFQLLTDLIKKTHSQPRSKDTGTRNGMDRLLFYDIGEESRLYLCLTGKTSESLRRAGAVHCFSECSVK
ncbi:hypothetical protein Q4595_19320, partial [Wenyingzhuangia sp. 1_MG-2023]|nr:hypothetical protein [Wenyingzhuangia sp. 1_MG-2023]